MLDCLHLNPSLALLEANRGAGRTGGRDDQPTAWPDLR